MAGCCKWFCITLLTPDIPATLNSEYRITRDHPISLVSGRIGWLPDSPHCQRCQQLLRRISWCRSAAGESCSRKQLPVDCMPRSRPRCLTGYFTV